MTLKTLRERPIVLVTMFLLTSVAGHAAPAYVTDQLRLGLHRAPDTSDQPFRQLLSGEQVEVLERSRFYARVRTSDGTEGYVKAGFLMSDRPAVLRVAEVEAKEADLDAQLAKVAEEKQAASQQVAGLEAELTATRASLLESRESARALERENSAYKQRFDRPSVPLTWALGGALFALISGFVLGLLWVDYRSRKLHGGIRVY